MAAGGSALRVEDRSGLVLVCGRIKTCSSRLEVLDLESSCGRARETTRKPTEFIQSDTKIKIIVISAITTKRVHLITRGKRAGYLRQEHASGRLREWEGLPSREEWEGRRDTPGAWQEPSTVHATCVAMLLQQQPG